MWGPLADLSWNGTPAKWTHEMTHICPTTLPKNYIPNLVAYDQRMPIFLCNFGP